MFTAVAAGVCANAVPVGQVTSSAFIKRHRLASASAVQSAIKKLLDKDFITEINKTYSLTDRLFALWIKTVYGTGFRL